MITEDYVSFEVAKLLKEKGFDENCMRSYVKYKLAISQGFNNSYYETMYSDGCYRPISAPTLQMAMKWLREVHGLFIHIDIIREASCWLADIQDIKGDVSVYPIENEFPNYEQACEAAIEYCLKHLIA